MIPLQENAAGPAHFAQRFSEPSVILDPPVPTVKRSLFVHRNTMETQQETETFRRFLSCHNKCFQKSSGGSLMLNDDMFRINRFRK